MLKPIQMYQNQIITQVWVKISPSNQEKNRLTKETTQLLRLKISEWRDNIFHLTNHAHLPLIIMREATLNRGLLVWDIVTISKIINQEQSTLIRNKSLLQLYRLQTLLIFSKGNITVTNNSLCLSNSIRHSMVLEMIKSLMKWLNSKVLMVNVTKWLMDKLIKSMSPLVK